MLTYRTGAAGAPSIAEALALHLSVETDVPELQAQLAEYYAGGLTPTPGITTGLIRRDINPKLAALLGIDTSRPLTTTELKNVLTGLRTDGQPIEGKQVQRYEKRGSVAYIDLTFSAPKSFSIALAFAKTPGERAILDRAHRDAVDSALEYISTQIGLARKGKGGRSGAEPGDVAWVQFDHYTARPTARIPMTENGITDTILQTVRVAGDPQRHTHCIVPNLVLTETGRVGSLHLARTHDRIHEWGAIYQAFLATSLRRAGVQVELELETGMARLSTVPRWICDVFSKRSRDGEEAARAYAQRAGIDWDSLTPKAKAHLLKGGTRARRAAKEDDLADYSEWKRQADEVGYKHKAVVLPGRGQDLAPQAERLAAAYEASLPVLAPELERRSKFEGAIARIAAAKGLIATGIESVAEIERITRAYRTEGVMQDGRMTALLWGRADKAHFASFTTDLHLAQETEAIRLLQAAAADRSSALPITAIDTAINHVSHETGIDFTSEHGQRQVEMIRRLGTGGRAGVGIGIAGSGKTTLLRPLVEAWHAAGRETIGVTLAWRQTHALTDAGVGTRARRRITKPDTSQLTDAGVAPSRAYALAAFIAGMQKGYIKADPNTVVVIDEIAQIGTRQVLDLARLQEKNGFQIVGLGDQRQCQAIEAGNTIRLMHRAFGEDQVPELLNTVRQQAQRDRETATMFREGRAAEALARKDEDGTLRLVPGGYRQAIEAAVDLWQQRRTLNEPNQLGISAPTNADAQAVSLEIRRRRLAAGEISGNAIVVEATDQIGKREFDLTIASGDRLRLFHRVTAKFGNGHKYKFGDNGSVMDVLAARSDGLQLRNAKGNTAFVPWQALRDPETGQGRIRLAYGEVLTIDSRQGDTLTEHITVMPGGSQAVNGFKAYTAESRHRVRSWIITSHGEEKAEIEGRRPLGDPRNRDPDPAALHTAIIENMARNLSRQPEKVLATDFLAFANRVRKGTIRAMQASWHRTEVEEAAPRAPTIAPRLAEKQEATAVVQATEAVETLQANVQSAASAVARVVHREKRAMTPMSETDAINEFATALTGYGLRLDGPPVMDGKRHIVRVEGDTKRKRSGSYLGHLDGWPAGHIRNWKTGVSEPWKSGHPVRPMTPDEQRAHDEQVRAARAAEEAARLERNERVARIAGRIWDRAIPAVRHPYLQGKDVLAHGLREDRQGRLLMPMYDEHGKLWNLQTIDKDGTKRFGVQIKESDVWKRLGGRKDGLFFQIGEPVPGKTVAIGEGYATMATFYEATGIPAYIAIDAGNLTHVAPTVRKLDQDRTIVFVADNDHHLPRRDLPNTGLEKATYAAREVDGIVLAPQFEPHQSGTDWNDRAALVGRQVARTEMRKILADLKIDLPPPAERQTQSQEQRPPGQRLTL